MAKRPRYALKWSEPRGKWELVPTRRRWIGNDEAACQYYLGHRSSPDWVELPEELVQVCAPIEDEQKAKRLKAEREQEEREREEREERKQLRERGDQYFDSLSEEEDEDVMRRLDEREEIRERNQAKRDKWGILHQVNPEMRESLEPEEMFPWEIED